jgi:acetyl/propionyl-CoA carboxylase alpha subunit
VRKLLVANRGEIARRVFRTCRAMGIGTVAVFSEPDQDAPFVREADEAVALGGATAAESYLRGEAIVAAALRSGADAVHPGYGFLSENAAFAAACRAAGLAFVGPSPEAIASMGSKLHARRLAVESGVPVLPASERADEEGARAVGYPLLVKASAGGGGRGMRLVREAGALAEALASARREAASAFGDDTLYLEHWLERPRHVEVQVLADGHGQVVHLFERECSMQRRHQKVIEEAPSPALVEEPGLRAAMTDAATALARAIAYQGAGTVEFLLGADGRFYFLEMNTRLQVEHAVTEAVTGLDLVRLQLLVADGHPLPAEALHPRVGGHAIEARLYAEDPARGYLPAMGRLHRVRFPERQGVRVDTGVEDGSLVSAHYDPLLAKVIGTAGTRHEAAARLAAALAGAHLHGVATNRDLLVRALRHPEFLGGRTDTGFLERHADALLEPLADAEAERCHALAATLAASAARRAAAPVLGFAPPGWRNNPAQRQHVEYEGREGPIVVEYEWRAGGVPAMAVNGQEHGVRVGRCAGEQVDLEIDGVRRSCAVHAAGDTVYVDSAMGATTLRERERFPLAEVALDAGTLRAPMPGVVVRVGVSAGDDVQPGAVVAVIEAMKMEHVVAAPRQGRVAEMRVREGQSVEAGYVLAVIDRGVPEEP